VKLAAYRADADSLALTRSRGGDGTVYLAVAGEVDIYTAPRLREEIASILTDPTTSYLIVDLADLEYIDSTGASVLVAGLRLGQRHGAGFRVVNAHGQVLRVFTVLCLDRVLAPDARRCA
jgi:anti-sigma B factor antagonist